jgi:hypothetical protein
VLLNRTGLLRFNVSLLYLAQDFWDNVIVQKLLRFSPTTANSKQATILDAEQPKKSMMALACD